MITSGFSRQSLIYYMGFVFYITICNNLGKSQYIDDVFENNLNQTRESLILGYYVIGLKR